MADPGRNRRRDILTLDIPLVLGLALCTTLTIVEATRAADGNGRALAYTFQWPIIGVFIVWIWYRYRLGSGRRIDGDEPKPRRGLGIADHYRAQVEAAEAEHDRASDPQLQAWQAYVDDLQRRDPPGQPPPEELRG